MSAWGEYLFGLRVSPSDIVDRNGMPWVLDLSRRPAGYQPGTYRCKNCGYDPYDAQCCRQRALPPELRADG